MSGAARTSMSAHDPRCPRHPLSPYQHLPCECAEIVALDAATTFPRPIIGSTTDPACCAWCGRAGGAPYCSSAHALADKAAAE